MSRLRVSAPAKVILHGEHSVVYGKTALAASIELRTTATLEPTPDHVSLVLPDLGTSYTWSCHSLLSLLSSLHSQEQSPSSVSEEGTPSPLFNGVSASPAPEIEAQLSSLHLENGCSSPVWHPTPALPNTLNTIRSFLGSDPDPGVVAFLHLYLSIVPHCPGMKVKLSSQIPVGAGLGSSAAMSVCLATGLVLLVSRSYNVKENPPPSKDPRSEVYDTDSLILTERELTAVCDWAFTAEQVLHGKPSGIDNSVATHGGVVAYTAGTMTPLQELAGLEILLTNTKVSRNTKAMVARVRERYDCLPVVVKPILEALDQVSHSALAILKECREKCFKDCHKQFRTLESLVDMNQSLLCCLGVSHPSLDQVVTTAKDWGLHTKLTGAGGGGVAFSLVTPDIEQSQVAACQKALEATGFECYRVKIGGHGVKAWRE